MLPVFSPFRVMGLLPFHSSLYIRPATRTVSPTPRLSTHTGVFCGRFLRIIWYAFFIAAMIRIGIFCDSRGGFFQYFLNSYNASPNMQYTVFTCKGRRFEELWLQAKHRLLQCEFEHVIIWGGICNITSPYFYEGRRFFWPLKQVSDLAYDLIFAYETVAHEVNYLGLNGRVTIMPETGGDLIVYNQIITPSPWMQSINRSMSI